jgi:propanediol dehydratase small subunit
MTAPQYPLLDHDPHNLRAASGRSAAEIDLDAASSDQLTENDLRISAETLGAQAQIAQKAGYRQLAANLARAAELTRVPGDELLQMYDLLRPGRASYDTLLALAERLEQVYAAPLNARFVREAADVYRRRNLLRREA